jgi:outer membrane protein assembly factor BamB
MNSTRTAQRLACLVLALGHATSALADPYTVIRTITHSENALWETAAGDLRPLVALGPDYFVISTKGLRLSGGVAYVFDAADGSFLRRLTAVDAAEGMEFGSSLAVDGGYALIGAPRKFLSPTNRGKVYLYDFATGAETLTFNQTDGDTSSDGFGKSVAFDGTTVVVGAPTAGLAAAMPMEFGRGFVYAFDQGTGALLRTFAASDWEAIAGLGESVAVKGNDVLAGAPNATVNGIDDVGKAYVYDLATGTERFHPLPRRPDAE